MSNVQVSCFSYYTYSFSRSTRSGKARSVLLGGILHSNREEPAFKEFRSKLDDVWLHVARGRVPSALVSDAEVNLEKIFEVVFF